MYQYDNKYYVDNQRNFRTLVIVDKETYVLSFQSGNGNFFDRTRSYNEQKTYTTEQDPEFFKNFEISPEEFVYNELPFYNNTFTIGTAYKEPYNYSAWVYITSALWYLGLLGFILFLLSRFYIYKRKNVIIAGQKEQLAELVATKNKSFNLSLKLLKYFEIRRHRWSYK